MLQELKSLGDRLRRLLAEFMLTIGGAETKASDHRICRDARKGCARAECGTLCPFPMRSDKWELLMTFAYF